MCTVLFFLVSCKEQTKNGNGLFQLNHVVETEADLSDLLDSVEYIPLERIVLETDCPYLAPDPNRGKRNSSLNLPYVVSAMAQIKGISEEEVRKAVWENGMRLYGMKG